MLSFSSASVLRNMRRRDSVSDDLDSHFVLALGLVAVGPRCLGADSLRSGKTKGLEAVSINLAAVVCWAPFAIDLSSARTNNADHQQRAAL